MDGMFAFGMEGIPLTNIVDPRDVDVLCGRGGAALRHPGNATYRRLVGLNKGFYITCLKTEKLKISRSIVAAIRVDKGRFLERDSNSGEWYDIGDKKAIEKTSQALREGQPKLRQIIDELGAGQPGMSLEFQVGNGIYSPGGGMVNSALSASAYVDPANYNMQIAQQIAHQQMAQQQMIQQQQMAQQQMAQQQMAQQQQMVQQQMASQQQTVMPPPATRQGNQEGSTNEMMMQQLNLDGPMKGQRDIHSTDPGSCATADHTGQSQDPPPRRSSASQLHPYAERQMMLKDSGASHCIQKKKAAVPQHPTKSILCREHRNNKSSQARPSKPPLPQSSIIQAQEQQHEHPQERPGISHAPRQRHEQQIRAPERRPEQYSQVQDGNHSRRRAHLPPLKAQQQQAIVPSPPPAPEQLSQPQPQHGRQLDRRRIFAKMKFTRQASGRSNRSNRSLDRSNRSLDRDDGMPDIHMVASTFSLLSNMSNQDGKLDENSDHKMRDDFLALGSSRRSLMSGLSKISDSSDAVNSIFSDLSRKIGNVSTRSIAMSEISGIEEGNHEDLDDSFHLDVMATANAVHMQIDS